MSVGYVLMYFLRGQLPWQGLKAETNNEKYKLILEKKMTTTTEELCNGFPGRSVRQYLYIVFTVCTYVSMYACIYVCMFETFRVCGYVCMYVCMYLCMYVCTYNKTFNLS